MVWVRRRKLWQIPVREETPEAAYLDRRRFLRTIGGTALGVLGLAAGCGSDQALAPDEKPATEPLDIEVPKVDVKDLYPATRNPSYALDRALTHETVASGINNFYEFTLSKTDVVRQSEQFLTDPWKLRITGLVRRSAVLEAEDLIKLMPLEERLYRFRCVERWAMAVPWTGFPLKAVLDLVQPLSSARYVKMTAFLNPEVAPGQSTNPEWPWPYVEGLTMEEATNELTLLATGIYGKPMSRQFGPPIRLVVPWKYGYKSIKSITRIEFTDEQPATFWTTLNPRDYDFTSNVIPQGEPPNGFQSQEWMIGTGDAHPTRPYNGYGDYVAHLY